MISNPLQVKPEIVCKKIKLENNLPNIDRQATCKNLQKSVLYDLDDFDA